MTFTWKVHPAVLPEPSVAVQVTVEAPSGKTEPEAGEQTTVAAEQLSAALGVAKVTMAPADAVATAATLAGQMMVGGVSSTTVTVAAHEADAPWLSVTVSVTKVAPSG